MKRLPRPSPALAIACLALFISLGGGAYAALKLPKNSVGAKQIRKGAVTSPKVKDHSLLAKDFKSGQLPAGQPGPAGPKGDPGPSGPPGPATGAAGGDLSGSYPNPTIAAGAVTPAKLGTFPAVRVTKSSDQTIDRGVETAVTFDTEAYDTDNLHSQTSNTSRLTAPIAGVYEVTGEVAWAPDGTGWRGTYITDKTGSYVATNQIDPLSFNIENTQNISTQVRLDAGDYVELHVFHVANTSGDTLNVDSDFGLTSFQMTWLAP